VLCWAPMGTEETVDRGADAGCLDPVLEDIVRRLVGAYQPRWLYLFGSRARGEGSVEADYDILVVVDASEDPMHRRARAGHAALARVPAAVDLMVWTREEFEERLGVVTSLPATVAREGKLLHAA
jgi:predicted nucleotidyltransferase